MEAMGGAGGAGGAGSVGGAGDTNPLNINLPKITLNYNSITKIELIPNNLYYILHKNAYKYFVIYNIILYINNIIKYSIETPYLISNAHTNHLRANILYPILCISNENSLDCPQKPSSINLTEISNVIFKQQFEHHINFNSINQTIIEELSEFSSESFNTELYKNNLLSIFKRISNTLDFTLAIASEKITNFNEDKYSKYLPVCIKGKEYDFNQNGKEIESGECKEIDDENKELIRLLILNKFKEFNELIFSKKNINLEYINLERENITVENFNMLDSVKKCPTRNYEKKYINFIKISHYFYNFFKNESIINLEYKKLYDKDSPLFFNFIGWKAQCKKIAQKRTFKDDSNSEDDSDSEDGSESKTRKIDYRMKYFLIRKNFLI